MKKFLIIILCCLAVAARAENVVSVSSVSGHPQDEVTLQVSLANTDAAVAFQAEIPLGNQLTYVANSVALNPDRVTDHQVTAAVVNGTLKIFAYSLSLSPFVGDSGNLLTFTLKLKNEPGDYSLNMSNSKLSNASGTALPISTLNGTVTILSPKLSINTASLNYGHVPIRSEYTQTAHVSNVGNEPLTISGITFSNAVFSCPSFAETTLQPGNSASFTFKFAPMLKGAVTATATIVSNSISGNGTINLLADPYAVNEIHVGNVTGYCDSIVELPISMNNMEDIIGFQIEFNLNTALEFVDFTLSDRKTDHVATGVVSGTTLRLMAYSPLGAAFSDEDGVLGTARFLLKGQYGNYNLNPFKAVLADANGEDVLSDKYQGYVTVRSPKINGNNSLDFGSTPVTETVIKEYVVRNNGNAPMRIDQVVFDQADFAVAEMFPITVNQSASTTLHVSYNREQKGNFNALMKIYSNDPQNGLKNVSLSGQRYEPNSIGLEADPLALDDGDVLVALNLDNYSDIVALQANISYPYQNYSVASTDFQLTDRFANHLLYPIQTNDSTYRVLILSMQNAMVNGHSGAALKVTLHPIGTPSAGDYTVSVSDVVLSEAEGLNVFTGEEVETAFTPAITQSASMAAGWNWWSTYIEQNNQDGLTALENGLGNRGLTIKSQNEFVDNYYEYMGYNYWYGSLESINNEQSYLVNVSESCDLTMRGTPAKSENHPVTIQPNWNWIGYSVGMSQAIGTAMDGFSPAGDDVIKSQTDYAFYYEGYGWYPDDFMMVSGKGYKYSSNATGNKTLTYSNVNRGDAVPEKTLNHWTFDCHAFADNLIVTANVLIDGVEQNHDHLELGAFVNGECRGSAQLRYFEPLDRYYALLTVVGQDGDRIEFGYFDLANGRCDMLADESIVFEADAIVGGLDTPLELHFQTDGPVQARPLSVFPNPVNWNQTFSLAIPQEETVTDLVVTDMLGAVVRHECGVVNAKALRGLASGGVYVVEAVTQSGNVYHGKLIVK